MTEDEFHAAVEELGYRASTFHLSDRIEFLIEEENGYDRWEPFLKGGVKWDGCSDWRVGDEDYWGIHFCSREQLLDLGKLLAACWDYTSKVLPNWCGD